MANMLYGLEGLDLSPQEINKVLYHRQNLANPFMQDGNPVTIYATGIQIPTGKDKGKYVSVPGYVNGRLVDNEEELWKIWKKDIQANKWPIYGSAKELNERDKWLHQIMDRDIQQEIESSSLFASPFEFTIK